VFLLYEDKTYTYGEGKVLRPGEVKHVDIRRLRDEQIEGENEAVIPREVVSGQVKTQVHNALGLFGSLDSEAIIGMDKRYSAPEHEKTRQNRSFPLTPGSFQAPWSVPSRHSRNWSSGTRISGRTPLPAWRVSNPSEFGAGA